MAKTARDAAKHARELRKLFKSGKEITDLVMDEFIQYYKKRKYLKQSLGRMIQRGLIVKRTSSHILTEKGARLFRRYPPFKEEGTKFWDGKWRLISFDVPGDYNPKRDQLRALLKEFDFYPLHKSVWVCPTYLSEDLWRLIVKEDLHEYCKVMLVEILDGDEELRRHFKLS